MIQYLCFLITDGKKKLARVKSIESIESRVSSTSSSSESSDGSLPEEKEEEEINPTTWQIMKLCEPEKWLMVAGVFAAIAVGSSFPTFAVLFGETYGVLITLHFSCSGSTPP